MPRALARGWMASFPGDVRVARRVPFPAKVIGVSRDLHSGLMLCNRCPAACREGASLCWSGHSQEDDSLSHQTKRRCCSGPGTGCGHTRGAQTVAKGNTKPLERGDLLRLFDIGPRRSSKKRSFHSGTHTWPKSMHERLRAAIGTGRLWLLRGSWWPICWQWVKAAQNSRLSE
jgi:hypothetical protein